MSSLFYDYEINEVIAELSGDKLSAYAVISNAYIPGSVKIVADGETVAWESDEGKLFNCNGPFQRDATNGLNSLERNDVNRKTWEVGMTFLKPVKKVQVQFFYVLREDEIKS